MRLSDTRPHKQQGHFDTPIVSRPGQREQREVTVSSNTVAEMRRRVGRVITGGDRLVLVDVQILYGYAGWEASWIDETAFAKAYVSVEFRVERNSVVITASGEASGRRSSIDVADEEPNELFQAALLAAFDRAVADPSVIAALSSAVR
jgi:hypothetical protein